MRLTRKLSLAMLAGIVVVLAIHGTLSVRRALALFSAESREHQRILGHALEPAIRAAWQEAGGAESALEPLEYTNELRDVRVRWVWLDAHPPKRHIPSIAASRLAAVRAGADVSVEDPDEGGRLYTYVPVPLEGQPAAALEISESLAAQKRFLGTSIVDEIVTLGGTALVVAVVVALLGAWIVGRPMRALAEKARRVGGGDLAGPLAIRQRDEIGEVATEMNAMCERLGAVLEQLRHADRLSTVGKLAAGVAHELGTPLNVVSGRAKMIAADVGGEARDSAIIVGEQADRMAAIIRQLLDFARRSGRPKSATNAGELARATALLIAPIAEKRGVALTVSADAALVVDADAGQLAQALTNLIMNGLQATKAGGHVVVTVDEHAAERPGRFARIEVADDGAGIAPADLDRVFEPFFTTKDVGEGTGLGLSVAYGIVEEHGGWIAVESEPGRGSRFRIFLPLKEAIPGGGGRPEGPSTDDGERRGKNEATCAAAS